MAEQPEPLPQIAANGNDSLSIEPSSEADHKAKNERKPTSNFETRAK